MPPPVRSRRHSKQDDWQVTRDPKKNAEIERRVREEEERQEKARERRERKLAEAQRKEAQSREKNRTFREAKFTIKCVTVQKEHTRPFRRTRFPALEKKCRPKIYVRGQSTIDALTLNENTGELKKIKLLVEDQRFAAAATTWERLFCVPLGDPRKGFAPVVNDAGLVIGHIGRVWGASIWTEQSFTVQTRKGPYRLRPEDYPRANVIAQVARPSQETRDRWLSLGFERYNHLSPHSYYTVLCDIDGTVLSFQWESQNAGAIAVDGPVGYIVDIISGAILIKQLGKLVVKGVIKVVTKRGTKTLARTATSKASTKAATQRTKSKASTGDDALDREIDDAIDRATSGERIELIGHGSARQARQARRLSGRRVESAHGAPQAAMRNLPSYDAKAALTRLLPKRVHREMDRHWQRVARQLKSQGRDSWTAQEMFDAVSASIRQTRGLTNGEKLSHIRRLYDEVFKELGLKPSDVLRLPFT